MTAHINAKKGEIAKTVLMPGDPLRAKYIAEKFLENVKQVNSVRNMFMFTGTYKGKEISVCGSGMGQPSIGIYSYELFKFYDVDRIIRIGSAGAYTTDLKLYDTILASEAFTDSTFPELFLKEKIGEVLKPSKELNEEIKNIAKSKNIPLLEERIYSSDVFYSSESSAETMNRTKARSAEMESAALFAVAKKLKKQAACMVTISDIIVTNEETTPKEREQALSNMIEIALELA